MSTRGVSPVIGVILMVAVTVALVALVTVVVFDIGGDVSDTPDATVQLEEQNGQITATVLRNENVDQFRLVDGNGNEEVIQGDAGGSGSLPAENGSYRLIAVLPDGDVEVLESITSEPTEPTGEITTFRLDDSFGSSQIGSTNNLSNGTNLLITLEIVNQDTGNTTTLVNPEIGTSSVASDVSDIASFDGEFKYSVSLREVVDPGNYTVTLKRAFDGSSDISDGESDSGEVQGIQVS